MGIAVSLFLFALGAILTFATDVSVSGLDLNVVGVVLMLVGAVGFVLTLVVWRPRRRLVRTVPPAEPSSPSTCQGSSACRSSSITPP